MLDLTDAAREAFRYAYGTLTTHAPTIRLMLTTYFGALGDNLQTALALPVHGLHIDLVRAPEQIERGGGRCAAGPSAVLGVIDGRNVWRADLNEVLDRIAPIVAAGIRSGRSLIVAPSCSLLHIPIDLERETDLDPDVKGWLAFAVQKITEVKTLARALNNGRDSVRTPSTLRAAVASRQTSPKINDPAIKARASDRDPAVARRQSPLQQRRGANARN